MILPILIFVLINSIGNAVGFEDVDIRDVPYHVSIRNKWNQHVCSGAITKSNAIVASGYCNDLKDITHIVAGTVYPSLSSEFHTQTIKITGKDIVTARTSKTYLVVFYLEDHLEFNEYVQQIKKFGMTPQGIAKVTGFTKVNNVVRLRSTEMPVTYGDCMEKVYDREDAWRLACIINTSKNEMCSVLEKSSLLLCSFNGAYRLCGFSMSSESDYVCESNNETSPFYAHFSQLFILESFLESLGVLEY